MKAKITTNAGTFEFEGDDAAVEKQIAAVLSLSASLPSQVTAEPAAAKVKKPGAGKKAPAGPRMIATLLGNKDEVDSVRAFIDQKQPATHIETFAVLTLWLRDNKQMESASIDEMWTLYKVLGIRQPKNMIQTFRDGKSKKSYFESVEEGRYTITPFGETFVEHDLPK